MAWTQRPSRREDIALEGRLDLDASGNFTTDWIETPGIEILRVAVRFNDYAGTPGITVQEGAHVDGSDSSGGPFELRTQTLTVTNGRAFQELQITARYFRLVATGGGTSNYVYVTARSVG